MGGYAYGNTDFGYVVYLGGHSYADCKNVDGDGDGGVEAAIPPDALKQILFNLLDNAREIAGPERPVTVRVGAVGDTVTVDVLDEGPGITDAVLPHVFDPFFTTKDAVTGVGLGLFVAEGLARRYGGRMEAANREDGPGARFRLEVPRAADGEATS